MTELWTGAFGNAYTRRNRTTTVDARAEIWRLHIPDECESVLEVGANIGRNLEAIRQHHDCELYACEPNDMARQELSEWMPATHITACFADDIRWRDEIADLVFTCGVLIHVPPDKLLPSMREIHRCAKHWIITAEYFSPTEEMIPYRGTKDTLWRRDYGGLWLDNFHDLHCVSCMFAWKRLTGLDNLTFWMFEKGEKRH